jgi:hypothetical protein
MLRPWSEPTNMVVTLDATDVMTTGNQFINHSEVTMSNRRPPGEVLLETAPYLRKWLNTCRACGQVGHKPDCPDPDLGNIYRKLKRCFPLLELNQIGLCLVCQQATGGGEGTQARA